jgi:hypothetical protein
MSKTSVATFIQEIKQQGIEIPKLQISSLGGLHFVSAFDGDPKGIMVNEVAAGVDYDADTAVTKSLVEFYERKVFSEEIRNQNPICLRRHSDGIASYPAKIENCFELAKENALAEATERFVWAKWWDDHEIQFSTQKIEESIFWENSQFRGTLADFRKIISIDSLKIIEPKVKNTNFKVIILLAEIDGLGFITGGAAGLSEITVFIRAFSELARHGVGLSRFIKTKQEPMTFYEKRLLYFGLGEGNKAVNERLSLRSRTAVDLPDLEIDHRIKSNLYDSIIATHRCLFQNQPPFVDGPLERLCL